MTINVQLKNDNFLMQGTNALGSEVMMDNTTLDNSQGASPMELLLMGLGGCSAIDIISILKKKRQQITDYRAEVKADREEGVVPSIFTNIHVKVYLTGDITEDSALRAAELSFDKYCSVSKILEHTAKISYSISLNGQDI